MLLVSLFAITRRERLAREFVPINIGTCMTWSHMRKDSSQDTSATHRPEAVSISTCTTCCSISALVCSPIECSCCEGERHFWSLVTTSNSLWLGSPWRQPSNTLHTVVRRMLLKDGWTAQMGGHHTRSHCRMFLLRQCNSYALYRAQNDPLLCDGLTSRVGEYRADTNTDQGLRCRQ